MSDALHLVCPHCQTVNRVPSARLTQQPNCGQCHHALFTGHPVELTTATLNKFLEHNDIPLLIDFWAPWCGPCRMMAPAFIEAAEALEPHFRLAKINTENEQILGAKFGIRSIPTLALFKNGKEVARQSGAIAAQDIVRWAHANNPAQ